MALSKKVIFKPKIPPPREAKPAPVVDELPAIDLPRFLSIKRRREESPLDVLVLETPPNKKPRLEDAFESLGLGGGLPLARMCGSKRSLFRLCGDDEDDVVDPNSLCFTFDHNSPRKRIRRSKKKSVPVLQDDGEDFVLDHYLMDTTASEEELWRLTPEKIIQLKEEDLVFDLDELDDICDLIKDEEDSNDEDYYYNDYPSEEEDSASD